MKFQIKRIRDDVEYYIEASLEPDYEDNECIYDDICGLDEVELSGVGIPSSGTTDSNSNISPGSPHSMLSGITAVLFAFTAQYSSPILIHHHGIISATLTYC